LGPRTNTFVPNPAWGCTRRPGTPPDRPVSSVYMGLMHVEKPSAGSVRALALTTCLLVFPQGGMQSGSVDAHQAAGAIVEDARPVARAMALLSRQLGWNITYEEPVYVNADDLFVVGTSGRLSRARAGCGCRTKL
jgi:hypothetical protein